MFNIDYVYNKNCKTLIICFIIYVIIPNVNRCNGFDFECIESFISFIFGYDIENIFNFKNFIMLLTICIMPCYIDSKL